MWPLWSTQRKPAKAPERKARRLATQEGLNLDTSLAPKDFLPTRSAYIEVREEVNGGLRKIEGQRGVANAAAGRRLKRPGDRAVLAGSECRLIVDRYIDGQLVGAPGTCSYQHCLDCRRVARVGRIGDSERAIVRPTGNSIGHRHFAHLDAVAE